MQYEHKTPYSLFSEIANFIITRNNTTNVESQIDVTPNLKTITGTVSYDFTADFILQYQTELNKLTLLLTSREENNDSTCSMIFAMVDDNTVQITESLNNKQPEVKTYDNRDDKNNMRISKSYVDFVLGVIENFSLRAEKL